VKKKFGFTDTIAASIILMLVFCQVGGTSSFVLHWTNNGDDGNFGRAAKNEIFISKDSTALFTNPRSQTPVPNVPVPTNPGTCQQVTVTGLLADTTYWARIRTADSDSNWSAWSNWARFVGPDTIAPAAPAMLGFGICP
jgi:hypothetical protein